LEGDVSFCHWAVAVGLKKCMTVIMV